jgi:hypothetical protein
MKTRDEYLASIAVTIADYRAGEIAAPSPDHVDRWVHQFDGGIQVPLLAELDHTLKQTYFARNTVAAFFANQIVHVGLAGASPCDFWKSAHVLDIQKHGHSQREIRHLFGLALKEKCGLELDVCGSPGGAYIYIDDVLFTGGRIGTDLTAWIADKGPAEFTLHVLVIATYRLGEWQCIERLKKAAADAGKKMHIQCWAALRLENRKARRDASEVLWPTAVPQEPALLAYLAEQQKFPFEPRKPGAKLEHGIFSSEAGRQLLEEQMLLAGMRIRAFSKNPNRALRPLGFSPFGLGFGSMISTFRNCPNNAPLALWWGDPDAPAGHPFRSWRPLLPRKTYADVDVFDVIA